VNFFWRFLAATHISTANCAGITKDRLGQSASATFIMKRSFSSLNFTLSLRSKNSPYRASNLGASFKILAFDHSNGSSHARRWRHLAYVNASYPMSVAGIGELRFCSQ